MNKRKKVLVCSNLSSMPTGFGRHNKQLLIELYKRDKYDLVEYGTGGVRKNDLILNKFPWKAYGAWVENDEQLHLIFSGKNEREKHVIGNQIAHGALYIDEIINIEKPDVLYFLEDIWQLEMFFDKPWWNTIPTIIHTPIDSLPLLKIFTEKREKLKNVWVKAEFGVKALQEAGLDAKFVPAFIEHNQFYPINPKDREGLRKISGLNDSLVIGFVARNQLRKLFVSALEGFALFKNKNPDANVKLLFHTNWEEEGAWRINEERERLGIDVNDVYATYVCNNCKGIQLMPYKGNGLNCQRCGSEKAVNNPSMALGVTEEELNAIYNSMDLLCHLATSGGFEMPVLEAMLAGVPVTTMPYAFGEMFCDSGLVEPIKFSYFREGTSQFLKSSPDIESVADVFKKVYDNRDYYKEIGLQGREWALQKFNIKQYIDDFESFIDSSESTYIVPENKEMVSMETFIKNWDKRRLVYIMPESEEDCFASIEVVQGLINTYNSNDWDIYVATKPEYFEVFEHLDVTLLPYHSAMDDFRNLEGSDTKKKIFDIAFHPYILTQRIPSYHHNGNDINILQ